MEECSFDRDKIPYDLFYEVFSTIFFSLKNEFLPKKRTQFILLSQK